MHCISNMLSNKDISVCCFVTYLLKFTFLANKTKNNIRFYNFTTKAILIITEDLLLISFVHKNIGFFICRDMIKKKIGAHSIGNCIWSIYFSADTIFQCCNLQRCKLLNQGCLMVKLQSKSSNLTVDIVTWLIVKEYLFDCVTDDHRHAPCIAATGLVRGLSQDLTRSNTS